ncbi:MAG TPA: hypothetical protein VHS33_02375 [Sphingomicrobium sp.]|jgi:hypothetical protein|nr:hypothetical protein [Sphingomicrobium sp.]
MKRQGVTESPASKWTRPDDYLEALALKRTFRRKRRGHERTEPESPRLLLSTVPFLALLGLLGILAVSIMVAAFPGSQPEAKALPPIAKQRGVAAKGWFEEAQREFQH